MKKLNEILGTEFPIIQGGMANIATGAFAAAGVEATDVDRFVFHQANKRIVDVAVRKLGVDPERCAGNIDHTGNTSAASVPILLDELVRTGELSSPARVVMAGFGAGLTWASCLVEVAP